MNSQIVAILEYLYARFVVKQFTFMKASVVFFISILCNLPQVTQLVSRIMIFLYIYLNLDSSL